ncbi:YihY/virulence factor BrkB family protein [Gorillibacterium massiliense]|uniref:YihY/virulence factor BrkB family protein n=1 Tax=Gorillibacterium massiliense TaxID=1280390 RepID=UPI0004B8B6E4|nr:YihY/virulence factor BrkB family protein [Gorillibacterium massiliense]
MKRKGIRFAQNLYGRFQDDEVPALSAQLTYYLILSFFPFLIFLVSIISSTSLSTASIISGITSVMPQASHSTIVSVLDEIERSRSSALLSIGMIGTIWSASKGVDAVMKAINKAYDQPENRPYWKTKGISLAATLLLAIAIVMTFGMLIFGKWIGERLFYFLHEPVSFDPLWSIAQYAIPLLVMALVFTLLYKYIPNIRLKFKEVLPGAAFSTIGWIVTSALFSFYVNHFGNYSKTYGSLGGIIVLLTWLYMSSIFVVLGGEINATLHFDCHGLAKPLGKKFALEQIPFLREKMKGNPESAPAVIKPLYRKEADAHTGAGSSTRRTHHPMGG